MFIGLKNIILLFLAAVMMVNSAIDAQQLFTSKKGKVFISFKYSDTTLTASSSDVLIKLNYSSAQADLILDTRDIKTGIDSLDTILYSSNKILHLFAELNLDYIDTKRHPKQSFTFIGTIYHYNNNSYTKSKITIVNGKGKLEHISEADNLPACILTLSFEIQPANLKASYPYNLMEENIKVEIIQTILKTN